MLRRWQPGSDAATVGSGSGVRPSRKFVERGRDGEPRKGVDAEFVVPASQVLHEGVAADDHAGGPVAL